MSIQVTDKTQTGAPTLEPCKVTLKDGSIVEAIWAATWLLIDGTMQVLDERYQLPNNGALIDPETIVSVSFFGGGSAEISWWKFEGTLYYFQGGCYYNSETKQIYEGPTTNFEIVVSTVINTVNNITEASWTFSNAYQYMGGESFRPCIKATRMDGDKVVAKYFWGTTELNPDGIFEDVLPDSVYDWDIFDVLTDQVWDIRNYKGTISGISLMLYQVPAMLLPGTKTKTQPSQVKVSWFNQQGDVTREHVTSDEFIPNFNTHGNQQSIEKNFSIAPTRGARVKVTLRTLKYPMVDRAAVEMPTLADEIAELEAIDNDMVISTSVM